MKESIRTWLMLALLCLCTVAKSDDTHSRLPVVRLVGNFSNEYQPATITIDDPDSSHTVQLQASIKWRGGTTNAEGKHKRNYKIKLSEDHQLFGLRSDDKWILDAGQADVFRLRNRIATELWNDFAAKPYYATQKPKALSGVRGRVVELYLNDEYRGVYSLTECMDRKQMKLKKFDADSTLHGLLWKSTGFSSSMMYRLPTKYDNTQPMFDVFEAKYPELDDLPQTDYSPLWNAIYFTITSSDDVFRRDVAQYFDIPVLIDYYLFINVLNAVDNTGKNMYWAVYDKQQDKKITFAVWDLDLTVGNKTLKQFSQDFLRPDYQLGDALNVITRLKATDADNFNQKLLQRYHELRRTVFAPDSLTRRYLAYYHLLKNSGAAQREEQRWSADSDVYGETIDFELELQYIANWIAEHIRYLDENVFHYHDDAAITTVDATQPDAAPTYLISGQQVDPSLRSVKGIVIRNGKKTVF